MSADELLQIISQALFVLVFVVTGVWALRRPRRASVDTALFFGVAALIIMASWLAPSLRAILPSAVLNAVVSSLLMALPYLLLRLVDDFAGVPIPIMRGAELGLLAAIVSLFAIPSNRLPLWAVFLYVLYFIAIQVYAALAFIRAARESGGVTRRRMQAVATGSLFLGLDILIAGVSAALPHQAALWSVLSNLCALGSGLGYFIGFAPPAWLKRAWQEPELRAFLGRAAVLPRLPDLQAIMQELERGAASSLGAPHASLCLWDEAKGVLWTTVEGRRWEGAAGEMLGGRVLMTQQPLLSADPTRDDPDHAEAYRRNGANALLAVPITAGEKRLGVLIAYGAHAPIFADDDLVLARLLADQAAVILESRTLIDEAARVRARAEATRLKDDFLSAAAHDLKTPLTTIVVQAQLLEQRARRDPAAPPDLPGIQRIVLESQRLKRLVTDLLDVARIEQGRLVGTRAMSDLASLAREACARHASARHPCRLDAEEPVVGAYDADRIAQVIDNLLENAVKYSPDGGEVCVTVRRDGLYAYLSVSDTGIGIPADDLPHLFERFHRGANVDDRRFAGMGLGLFICHAIVEQHGGRLWATSPGAGKGSAFHVMLPIGTAEKARFAHSDGTINALATTLDASTLPSDTIAAMTDSLAAMTTPVEKLA